MSTDPMAEIRASFFIECEELLESLQDALNVMDEGGNDSETINVVFRAVHSIKGGAGAFGLDALVGFAHRYETVMDEVRSGRLDASPDAIKLFFQAADMLQDHVRAARDDEPAPEGSERVLKALEALLGEHGLPDEDEEVDFTPAGLSFDFDLGDSDEGEDPVELPVGDDSGWLVKFKPHPGLYVSGNEPLLILRTLGQLGNTETVCNIPDDLPAPAESNAEQPVLSWEVKLRGDVVEDDIRQVFDFVADVCDVEIQPFGTGDGDGRLTMLEIVEEEDDAADPDDAPKIEPPKSAEKLEQAAEPPLKQGAAAPTPTTKPAPKPKPPTGQPPVANTGGGNNGGHSSEPAATVRVDLEKIDRLVNLVGELVINQAMLSQSVEAAGLGTNSDVTSGLESFMMLTRDIQESVMMIRAQPVKPLFQRMGRIVREASASVGKEVKLRTEGEYTEVDKTVIERLADPLTHMIRNAVDHGLESPEARIEANKPTEGIIVLSANHRAGRILIEIEDDGAGINRPKVKDIAIQKGLIPPDAQLSDSEIDNLLFLPGFSTASEVSALSGRGVGMDVVKSAITSLGGRISIQSNPGTGTKFSISLPLTLAVLDGMVVQAADQTLVVPLSAIIETATLQGAKVERLASGGDLMQIRGELVPLLDLGSQLGFRSARENASNGIVLLTTQENGRRAALIVDAIMEQRQVVIKGLGQSYGNIPGVAAATILGDGQIALILDPADLAKAGLASPNSELKAAG